MSSKKPSSRTAKQAAKQATKEAAKATTKKETQAGAGRMHPGKVGRPVQPRGQQMGD